MDTTAANPNLGDSAAPVLQAKNIKKAFGKRSLFRSVTPIMAVNDVSLSLAAGRTLGIVGESGCGKSTLARILVGIAPTTAGTVTLDGEVVSTSGRILQSDAFTGIQMVFQSPAGSLNPRMRIDDIVAEPLDIHFTHLSRGERKKRVTDMMRRVGLDDVHLTRHPHELSGGQQQRVGIARALITNPKVVICDEAVSALDVSVQAQVINLLLEIQAETGVAYLFISHDLGVVAAIADDIAVMYMGRIVETGAAHAVLAQPRHPYTSLLLDSAFVPDPRVERQRIRSSTGEAAQGSERPDRGCAFRPRCKIALPTCAQIVPQLALTDRGDTQVACHNFQANR